MFLFISIFITNKHSYLCQSYILFLKESPPKLAYASGLQETWILYRVKRKNTRRPEHVHQPRNTCLRERAPRSPTTQIYTSTGPHGFHTSPTSSRALRETDRQRFQEQSRPGRAGPRPGGGQTRSSRESCAFGEQLTAQRGGGGNRYRRRKRHDVHQQRQEKG